MSQFVDLAKSLILVNVFSRAITFTLNHFLLTHYVSASTLGLAYIQLELLLNSILGLSRESIRHALLRGEHH